MINREVIWNKDSLHSTIWEIQLIEVDKILNRIYYILYLSDFGRNEHQISKVKLTYLFYIVLSSVFNIPII